MMASGLKKWLLPLSLVMSAVLMLSAMWWPEKPKQVSPQLESTRVNLALRETGDRLLDIAGDSTSTIAPVVHKSTQKWLLQLEHRFSYDSLPGVLRKALLRQGIRSDYYVSVLRCKDDKLMLGYMASTYELEGEAPCGGRDINTECLNIELAFLDKEIPQSNPWKARFLGLSVFLFLAAIGNVFYLRTIRKPRVEDSPVEEEMKLLRFGQSSLDFVNQKLWVNGQFKDLTFREAKLLHYLIQNANQVLDRERVLEAIWQDEGMLVGRSLDVFVSRLRKLLKEDNSIKISSVHGVGYRFEVIVVQVAK
ncbi:MAG: winged helix-turn-helix domain-containing protein [Haliscomenobacter sp.]|uniref:winged helix-turn-helix domain-containing protein n=1 Tax=Haliscomenobacter sp. TaxID=2717303 RepID=UPI0029A34497|nr:winged helix-turn-helix domain-containing protein [Haliscomenobacter sp.]MDX2069305.1 winged helix-turn-helix domain-containing protein [Haliscomenobacter sp.]